MEFERSVCELRATRDDGLEAQRKNLPRGGETLDRRHRAYKSWQAAETYRQKIGCSTQPVF